jgi:ABC-type Mn2+/Zn2+ transport system permease subunit
MTRHARHLACRRNFLLVTLNLKVAASTGHPNRMHRGWHVLNPTSTHSGIQIQLRRMATLMTAFAHTAILRLSRSFAVTNLKMTVHAVYFAFRHVLLMHQISVVKLTDSLLIVMAGKTSLLRNLTP